MFAKETRYIALLPLLLATACSVDAANLRGSRHSGPSQPEALNLAARTNYLANGDFEAGTLASWNVWENKAGTTFIKNSGAHGGRYLAIAWNSASTPFQSLLSQSAKVPNGTYNVSCFIQGSAVNGIYLEATKFNATSPTTKVNQFVSSPSAYTNATLSNINVTSGTIAIDIWFDGGAGEYVMIDDCSVTAAGSAPSPTPAPAPAPAPAPSAGNLCTSSEPTLASATGKTFYVSPNGNDSNSGLATSTAWKTLGHIAGRVNSGDQVLLEGGATFNEGLYFGPIGGGINNTNEAVPITISTYGSGRATLQTGCSTTGIRIYDTGGFNVSNLKLVGCTTATPTNPGVQTYLDDGKSHGRLHFTNMDVGYYNFGFQFLSGFNDVSVARSSVHDVQSTGIYFEGGTTSSYAGYNEVTNVANGFGYGIYFYGTVNGLAEYNVVHGIGGNGAAYGQGIATQGASNITIQYNEIYNILKGSHADDNGIIIDADSVNTTSQYNYIHDIPNGVGVALTEWDNQGPAYTGHSVRYNLMVNVGTGLLVEGMVAELPAQGNIYNNTIVSSNGQKSIGGYFNLGALGIYNNAFVGQSGAAVGMILYPDTSGKMQFLNNGYYSPGAPYSFGYRTSAGASYSTYAGLAAFRSGAGQEGGSTKPVGTEANPMLAVPATAPTLGLANISARANLLNAYQLSAASPLQTGALNLKTALGIDPGTHDFWCNAVSSRIGN